MFFRFKVSSLNTSFKIHLQILLIRRFFLIYTETLSDLFSMHIAIYVDYHTLFVFILGVYCHIIFILYI